MAFQENRANQVVCTGISQIVLGFGVFALTFTLNNRSNDLGKIFDTGVTYWGAVPIVVAGSLGIFGGISGKFIVTGLFLAASVISCILGAIVAACVGVALTARRSVGECEHVQCPYDTESILMIALISILILESAISLSGVIESSQLLCCAISNGDQLAIVSLGNSEHADRKPRLNRKRQSTNHDVYSVDFDAIMGSSSTSPVKDNGFKNGKQAGTIV
ncbi:uncharacterized protein LOC111324333 isoform X1 [Stylophora pistillata]|uniref:Uncharacterized protein n=1 Tax=Stylophora pistillata TaxID=50429 RepID=A0A2B4SMT6_STYPI|nr:uncharacterized protein LOC111324333 isoform X1 [Stylophora pistillata]PFX29832.1 hypothetical protein AWC38_SpisGene5358 [Stylophora pistillata]